MVGVVGMGDDVATKAEVEGYGFRVEIDKGHVFHVGDVLARTVALAGSSAAIAESGGGSGGAAAVSIGAESARGAIGLLEPHWSYRTVEWVGVNNHPVFVVLEPRHVESRRAGGARSDPGVLESGHAIPVVAVDRHIGADERVVGAPNRSVGQTVAHDILEHPRGDGPLHGDDGFVITELRRSDPRNVRDCAHLWDSR